MGIIEKIRHAFGPSPGTIPADRTATPEDSFLGTQLSTTGVIPDIATSATNPALHDVGASGVQPMQKPVELEREENPEARRENEVVRKD